MLVGRSSTIYKNRYIARRECMAHGAWCMHACMMLFWRLVSAVVYYKACVHDTRVHACAYGIMLMVVSIGVVHYYKAFVHGT